MTDDSLYMDTPYAKKNEILYYIYYYIYYYTYINN